MGKRRKIYKIDTAMSFGQAAFLAGVLVSWIIWQNLIDWFK